MNDILFEILNAVIIIAVIAVTRYLIPWIKAKTTGTQYEHIFKLVEDAVKAIEQTVTESGKGEEKKEEVMKYVRDQLNSMGIMITDEQLSTFIESAVYAMNQKKLAVK